MDVRWTLFVFFFQAEDGIRDADVTGVQTCALPILTNLHPMVKFALELLGKPNANELMEIIAVAGLAQNFAAIKSLTTTGIQEGHMKMHLMNILNQLQATDEERKAVENHFQEQTVSHRAVVDFVESLRK